MTAHALLTRPAYEKKVCDRTTNWETVKVTVPAKADWWPLRDVKREATPLSAELKKAGLI